MELYYRAYNGLSLILNQSIQKGRYTIPELKQILYFLHMNNFNTSEEIYSEIEF